MRSEPQLDPIIRDASKNGVLLSIHSKISRAAFVKWRQNVAEGEFTSRHRSLGIRKRTMENPSVTPSEIFLIFSHLAIGGVAAFGENLVHQLPWPWARLAVLLAYVVAAWLIFRRLRRRQWTAELQRVKAESDRWQRFWFLNSKMLKVIGQFLKDRYKVNCIAAHKLSEAIRKEELTRETYKAILREFDRQRGQQVKDALGQVSSDLLEDPYLRPAEAEAAVRDSFKVSFYSVQNDEHGAAH